MIAGAYTGALRHDGPPPLRQRAAIMAAVALLHLAIFALVLAGFHASGVLRGPSQHSGTSLTVLNLADRSPAAASTAETATPTTGTVPGSGPAPDPREKPVHAPAVEGGGVAGDAQLGDALAAALADNPFAGAGRADYLHVLRAHIARHRKSPDGAGGRLRLGTAVIRINLDREGAIIDARVLKTQGSTLDEAALATLWRSEPLPAVPSDLPAPLSVDVPIQFVRG